MFNKADKGSGLKSFYGQRRSAYFPAKAEALMKTNAELFRWEERRPQI